MKIFEFKGSRLRQATLTMGLAGAMLSTGCAPHMGGYAQSAPAPVAKAPVVQPLPEKQNENRYAQPVEETEVVQVYGYPIVNTFDSQSL